MTSSQTAELSQREKGQLPSSTGDIVDVTYPVKLTTNILDELKERKKTTKVPVATQIRHMVETQMGLSTAGTSMAAPSLDTQALAQEIVKQTLQGLIPNLKNNAHPENAVCVDLSQSDRSKFDKTAANFGFDNSSRMLEELAKWVMSEPAIAEALVFKRSSRSVQNQIDERFESKTGEPITQSVASKITRGVRKPKE